MIINGERALAYTAKITDIKPIAGADNIELGYINGWSVIIKIGEFKVGDPCIFFEIDSKLPETAEWAAFMAKKNYKVKTMKLNKFGVYSQGLALPYEAFEGISFPAEPNIDVTDKLGVKYIEQEDNIRKEKIDKVEAYVKANKKKYGKHMDFFVKNKFGRAWITFLIKLQKKKKGEKQFPTGKFTGVSKTDQTRCLFAKTMVITDQGNIEISKIVNSKLNVKVLSMNPDGTLSFKRILDYQKFPNTEDVLTIVYPFKPGVGKTNSIVCTPDHRLYTSNGYVEAQNLKVGDIVYTYDTTYGEDCIGAVYGMLLGDSCITADKRASGKVRITATNGEAQLDYLNYKRTMFNDNGCINNKGKGSFGTTKDVYGWSMLVDAYIDKRVREDFYREGKKKVTQAVCDSLNEVGLALWYMDDGNLSYRDGAKQRPNIRMNTQGFTKEENELLCKMLNDRFGISCHPTLEHREGKPDYYHIFIDVEGTPKFLQLVTPYMCESMKYKTTPDLEYLIETKTPSYKKAQRVFPIPILEIKTGQRKFTNLPYKPAYVYDIEVEDNHNFIAGNIVSHNCENMPWVLQDKTPFIVTQKCDGSSGTYILERKPFGRYEFYVCSRNVRILKPEQECFYGEHNYYWEVAQKYDIERKMRQYLDDNRDISFVCWQGEICAPAIQKNPHKLKETHFYCFHWTDSKYGRLDIRTAAEMWKYAFKMEVVPIIDCNYIMPDDFEEFKKTADTTYDPSCCEGQSGCKAEGYVYYKTTDPTFSFKNVSREYLLKH